MLPLAFTTRPINARSDDPPLPYKAASNSNLAETSIGIAGTAKVKVRGLVPEVNLMTGVAMKSMV